MYRNLKFNALGSLMLLALFASPTADAQQTRTLDVTANVPEICVIVSPANISLDFGDVDPTNPAGATATAVFEYRCSQGTALTIEMNAGIGPGASFAERVMVGTATSDTLPYRLEKDDTSLWGDDASGNAYEGTAAGITTTESVGINGFITQAAAEQAQVDSYTDTVTITLLP